DQRDKLATVTSSSLEPSSNGHTCMSAPRQSPGEFAAARRRPDFRQEWPPELGRADDRLSRLQEGEVLPVFPPVVMSASRFRVLRRPWTKRALHSSNSSWGRCAGAG